MSEILYTKNNFQFVKIKKNCYSLTFDMENPNIFIEKIIDFNLVKLIYDLNGDIYEKVNIENINENEAIMTILIKHLFEDLGLPQRFSYIHIKKTKNDNKIIFTSQSIRSERPDNMPEASEQIPIQKMICECNLITPHKLLFTCDIIFEDYMVVPAFAEKMVGLIIYKIFNRVKQFIENIKL